MTAFPTGDLLATLVGILFRVFALGFPVLVTVVCIAALADVKVPGEPRPTQHR